MVNIAWNLRGQIKIKRTVFKYFILSLSIKIIIIEVIINKSSWVEDLFKDIHTFSVREQRERGSAERVCYCAREKLKPSQ